jgi:hypothetical protein
LKNLLFEFIEHNVALIPNPEAQYFPENRPF